MVDLNDVTLLKGILPKNDVSTLKFIFAGNSIFTVKNNDTGNRFTFKVNTLKKRRGDVTAPYFVSVLTGPEQYSFIGTCFFELGVWVYRHSKKSKITEEATSVKVFKYCLKHLQTKTLPSQLDIYHEGCCGRCGKTLTVPNSITTGFGPECIKLVNKEK